ncbi:MAG: S8 family serine peptidase, partial [Bacteroidia bacterium]|nr:S8 family serine peptidase [Bacteroidia bacterium]
MKRTSRIAFLIFLIPVCLSAQIAPGKYFVAFADKNNNPFSISNPSAYLSPRALNRRAIQNISINSTDLPVTPSYVTTVAAQGATILNKTKWLNGVIIQTNDTNIVNAIRLLPFVSGIKSIPHHARNVSEIPRSKDKFENITLTKNRSAVSTSSDYGGAWNQLSMLHGDFLHDAGFRGAGMLIAVLDAGFIKADSLAVFDSLRANNRIVATRDFVDGDTMVYDHHWHGTSVLSCMAANLPGTMIGTAPDASYILLRTEDAATEFIIEEYNWACGAEFADSAGADVFNSSLGYTTFDDSLYNHTYADMNGDSAIATQAADIAASKGILVVNSAGNSGGNSWNFIGAPADADSILAIGAVDSLGVYASFSSRGPSFDGRVKPDVCAQGSASFVAYTDGSFGPGSGTSFASPIMAGMAACLWQSCSSYSNMQILRAIQISADHFLMPDTLYGYGIPDFSIACLILNGNTNVRDDLIISLYPNPFTENCIINFYSSIRQSIHTEVFDILGKKVLDNYLWIPAIDKYQLVIDANELPQKGMYVL